MNKSKIKMSKKKKIISIGSAVVAMILIISIVVLQTSLSVDASNRFPGVDKTLKYINDSTTDTSYSILEIVPDSGMGEIGYYVKDGEYNYITDQMITALGEEAGDTLVRTGIFETIKHDLQEKEICAPDDASEEDKATYPLYGGDYAELTFLGDEDKPEDWHVLALPATTSASLNGSYVAVEGTGTYDEGSVIEGFVAALGGKYNLTFVQDITKNQIAVESQGARVLYGAYELQVDGTYKKVANGYSNADRYYYVSGDPVEVTDASGQYDALMHYEYNPTHTGGYEFKQDDAQSLRDVSVGEVFYQSGFTNNEWFKKDVFGLEDQAEYPKFNIEVVTLTQEELSKENMELGAIPEFDLMYIAGNTLGTEATYASVQKEGEAKVDPKSYVDYPRMQTLLINIFQSTHSTGNRSCIIDYSIFDQVEAGKEEYADSYIYKLAIACLQPNVEATYTSNISGQNDENQVDWDELYNQMGDVPAVNHNYAKDNIYCFYDASDVTDASADVKRGLISRDFATKFNDSDTISTGFQAIVDLIDSENTLRHKDDRLSADISQARAVQYIINAWNPRQIAIKNQIRVLEIEPCASYDLTEDKIRKEWAKSLIEQAGGDENVYVTVDKMTTAEFIGKIEDLNTVYDMIYIGTNVDKMNTKTENGRERTDYNDNNMDGLVYTHIGDLVTCADEIGGLLNRDYVNNDRNNYQYSEYQDKWETYWENLQQKRRIVHEKLLYGPTTTYNYSAGNLRIGLGNISYTVKNLNNNNTKTYYTNDLGVYRYSGNDLTKFKMQELVEYISGKYAVVVDSDCYKSDGTVDESYVDNSSYMYQFLDYAKDFDNLIKSDKQNGFTLSNTTKFVNYLNMNKLTLNVTDQSSVDTRTLSYTFSISSNVETDANTTYGLKYYIDINADGKYSSKETVTDVIITSEGQPVEKDSSGNYILHSGINYVLTKSLGSTYTGYIPYKIEVNNSDPDYKNIRTSYPGFIIMSTEDAPKEVVKILQIGQSTASGKIGTEETFNMSYELNNSNSTFSKLANDLKDFKLEIDYLSSNDYVARFNEYAANGKNYIEENGYNMLVLGFADGYNDINDDIVSGNRYGMSPLGGVLKFINDGKSVLFTHDTTSFVNQATKDQFQNTQGNLGKVATEGGPWWYWGYNINSILRSVVGMDRFGITGESNSILSKGHILNFTGNDVLNTDSVAKASVVASDYAYLANGNQQFTAAEVQGFTNNMLNYKKLDGTQHLALKDTITQVNGNGAYPDPKDDWGNVTADYQMYASQVNQGQITQYPFELKESIPVATTHYQYYQLDLDADNDGDEESDIVVWYTLSNVTKDGDAVTSIYDASPNDVRNNYYIYSKGNVMYSGVGHSAIESSNSENLNDPLNYEIKLFLNTMIAAYKNGVQEPVPTIKETSSITSASKENDYISFDDSVELNNVNPLILDKDLTINFEVEDPNLTTNTKEITAEYYIADENGSTTVPGTDIKANVLELTTTDSAGETATVLSSGQMYQAVYPNAYMAMRGKASKTIYVVLRNKFNYYGKDFEMTGYDTLNIVRTQLFDLN